MGSLNRGQHEGGAGVQGTLVSESTHSGLAVAITLPIGRSLEGRSEGWAAVMRVSVLVVVVVSGGTALARNTFQVPLIALVSRPLWYLQK